MSASELKSQFMKKKLLKDSRKWGRIKSGRYKNSIPIIDNSNKDGNFALDRIEESMLTMNSWKM